MTNAEKYLKDGTNINELAREMLHEYYEDTGITIPLLICTFFDKETKPTLTEDERVILRNAQKDYVKIIRDETGAIYFRCDEIGTRGIFSDLFKFIKER